MRIVCSLLLCFMAERSWAQDAATPPAVEEAAIERKVAEHLRARELGARTSVGGLLTSVGRWLTPVSRWLAPVSRRVTSVHPC